MIKRLANSTVVWSWILNGLRVGTGVIVLPLIFRQLPSESDIGMYQVFIALAAFSVVVDFGFGPTIDRFIGYAMGGAESLEARGLPEPGTAGGPNSRLLWELLLTTRRLYRYLTLALFLVLGAVGTIMVHHVVGQTSSPGITWLAWATTLASTLFDIYSGWWGTYLRGLNEVRSAVKIGVLAGAVKLVLSAALLLAGAGLLSVPVAGLISSFLQRHYARVRCLQVLPPQPKLDDFNLKKNLAALWPNSWRQGLHVTSVMLTTKANTLICAGLYDLAASGKYGASAQVLDLATSMAYVWTIVKWPLIFQYQARRDFAAIQHALRPRLWLQFSTHLCLCALAVFVAPGLLHWIGRNKELLPVPWMLFMSATFLFDLQFTTATTLIASGNRMPYLWPAIAGNLLSLGLSLSLARFTSLGIGGLVLGPLISGCLFNYWYWPLYAARTIKTTLFRLLFSA
jgi:O-antigen/teichoic acid export membrane protein